MKRSERLQGFVDTIWEWYGAHKRVLPWRDLAIVNETERGYRILVSEVMLQQTQVSRVIVIYRRFLEQFPTLADLASASNKDVILAWRGMGYNSRALRLRDAAKTVVEERAGVFPRDFGELRSIKGIGPYTAGAIRNFGFNLPTPCIDTNIRRILHRVFVGPENPDGTWEVDDKELLNLAAEVLDLALKNPHPQPLSLQERGVRDTANWHAALMDFGSLVQTKSNPKWNICPLTHKGIMKTTEESFMKAERKKQKAKIEVSREPGRLVGSKFIPNRIFRGKIVEALRDAERGLPLEKIGREVCIDWAKEHKPWLQNLIKKLVQDGLLAKESEKYVLAA